MVILTKQVAAGGRVLAPLIAIFMGGDTVARGYTREDGNRALVQASFDRWKNATAAATVRDGKPYHNAYTWYFQMRDAPVVKAIALFDTRDFGEFWNRVSPAP